MDGKVILITGAAGTGKSTLVRSLLARAHPLRRVDFGQMLLDYKARTAGLRMAYDELRRDSASVITAEDVRAVDEELIASLPKWRAEGNVPNSAAVVWSSIFTVRRTRSAATAIGPVLSTVATAGTSCTWADSPKT